MRRLAAAALVGLLVLVPGCGDGRIVGPDPDVAGTWSLTRSLISTEGCGLLLDPRPIEIAILEIDFHAIQVDLPAPPGTVLTLSGWVGSDGDFEVQAAREEPGFSSETVVVAGTFAGDALTAVQTSDARFLSPELIELMGSDRCHSVIRWEGERV